MYNLLFPVMVLLAAPAWLAKMKRRRGWGTGLVQRVGWLDHQECRRFQGCDYYHAVSVGEVQIALKLIREFQLRDPEYTCVLAVTTATGHQVAVSQTLENVFLIYSPIDFLPVLSRVFSLLRPTQVILVDSEIWPNLLVYLHHNGIPVSVVNGRISDRSYSRFQKVRLILKPLMSSLTRVCVDGEEQVRRWHSLGVPEHSIHDVGNLKFETTAPHLTTELDESMTEQLNQFGGKGPVILLASTHLGEEVALVNALPTDFDYRLLIAPRHEERRDEISREFSDLGFEVVPRSSFRIPCQDRRSVFLIDTTGELSSWIGLADFVIIGKSWLKKGGQNPFESVALGKPTLCGPWMGNFEPLISDLVEKHYIVQLTGLEEVAQTVQSFCQNPAPFRENALEGQEYLQSKSGAVTKTVHLVGEVRTKFYGARS